MEEINRVLEECFWRVSERGVCARGESERERTTTTTMTTTGETRDETEKTTHTQLVLDSKNRIEK